MTRKVVRLWRPVNSTPRRGNGGGYAHSRSLSPRSRGRQTPPLPESSSRHPHYKPALVFALTSCVGHTVHVQLIAKELPIRPRTPRRPSQSPVLPFPMAMDSDNVVIQFGDFEDIGFLGDNNRVRDGAGLFGRKLKKWEPDEESNAADLEDIEHEVGTWDQFEENERKFGIKTDFNMDLYTTRLEPEKSKYTVAQAEKLAKEIQSASSPNLHLQDERGQLTLDDSGVSEEVLYSSVNATAIGQDKITTPSPKSKKPADVLITRSSKSSEPMKASRPLILNHPTQPVIIPPRRQMADAKELARVVKDISSAAPLPQGSPLNTSALLHDHDGVKALDLFPGIEKKTLRGNQRVEFINYKAQKQTERAKHGHSAREETIAKFKEFSESLVLSKSERPKSETRSPMQSRIASRQSTDEGGMASQLTESGSFDLASQDAAMQRELTPLKIEPNEVDEDLDEGDSGPGLNPHARPFNPAGHYAGDSVPTVPSGSDGSGVDPQPPSARAETPIEKDDDDDFLPLQSIQPPPVQPPVVQPSQSMVLIRPQPPPPPPRVVTPPPPPPSVQVPPEMPQMILPMMRPPPRTNRGSSSPAGRRTPHQHQPMQDPQMIMNPPMLMHSDSAASQGSGPQMHSNGQPPQMVPMMPTMSGPMPMMPQQMAYHYPEGRVPVFFPYGPVPHVQPHQAPPGQNPPQEQMPQMVYPAFYPAGPMSQYPMTYPHMIPPGLPQHYMAVPHTPMTPQQRPAQQRPRPNRRKSFLNYGPRRG